MFEVYGLTDCYSILAQTTMSIPWRRTGKERLDYLTTYRYTIDIQ